MNICEESGSTFIHPFDDPYIVAGSGTVGMEIMESLDVPADYVFVTIGGGGLAAGVGTYVKTVSPSTRVIGVEPEGAASMTAALERREVLTLETIDKFVDGAAVKRVGQLPYEICSQVLDDVILVPEGKACTTILQALQRERDCRGAGRIAACCGTRSVPGSDSRQKCRLRHQRRQQRY